MSFGMLAQGPEAYTREAAIYLKTASPRHLIIHFSLDIIAVSNIGVSIKL